MTAQSDIAAPTELPRASTRRATSWLIALAVMLNGVACMPARVLPIIGDEADLALEAELDERDGDSDSDNDASGNYDVSAREAGLAEVVVLRLSPIGWLNRMLVYADHEYIGYTGARSYVNYTVAPGYHTVGSSGENYMWVPFIAEPGETYYFRQRLRSGFALARVYLEPVRRIDIERALLKLPPPRLTASLPGRPHWRSVQARARQRGRPSY